VVGNLKVAYLACPELASVEQKEHVLFRVTMVSHVEDLSDLDLDAAFLATFADQRLLRGLPVLELAAGKLPHPRQVLPLSAPREQHAPVADYDSSRNDDRGGGP
jgi:hypothetical protein